MPAVKNVVEMISLRDPTEVKINSLLELFEIGNKFPTSNFFYRKLLDIKYPIDTRPMNNFLLQADVKVHVSLY